MELSERDRLIADRIAEKERVEGERLRVNKLSAAAREEVERQKEPALRLERLQIEGSQLTAQLYEGERIFKQQIAALAPDCLKNALAKVKSLESALGFDACNQATGKLEKLLFQPGDVTADVSAILGDLFGSVADEITAPLAPQRDAEVLEACIEP